MLCSRSTHSCFYCLIYQRDGRLYQFVYLIIHSSGVYLCGHSAGGQLAAILLSVDWMAECMIPSSLIKGTCCCLRKQLLWFQLTGPQAMNTGLFISIIELLTKNTLVQDSILNAANFLFYTLMYLYFLIPLSIYLLMYILLLQDHSLNIFHFEICFLQIYGLTFIFEYNAACISVYIYMQTKFIFIFSQVLYL